MIQRGLFVFVLAFLSANAPMWAGVPQIVHRLAQVGAGGGIRSVILVLNDGEQQASFHLEFFEGGGTPLEVTIGESTASSFDLTVPPRGTTRFVVTSSSTTPVAGWAQLLSSFPIGVQLLFEISADGNLVTQAAVEPAATTHLAELFVDTKSGNTGVALANPSGLGGIVVRIILKNDVGEVLGTYQSEIPALGHFAKFVSEIFPEAAETTGSLEVSATGLFTVITLQQTGLVLGTLPVITPSS